MGAISDLLRRAIAERLFGATRDAVEAEGAPTLRSALADRLARRMGAAGVPAPPAGADQWVDAYRGLSQPFDGQHRPFQGWYGNTLSMSRSPATGSEYAGLRSGADAARGVMPDEGANVLPLQARGPFISDADYRARLSQLTPGRWSKAKEMAARGRLQTELQQRGYTGVQSPIDDELAVFPDRNGGFSNVRSRFASPEPDSAPAASAPLNARLPAAGGPDAWREHLRGQGFDVGTPLYHGTRETFDAFSGSQIRRGPGVWVTDDPRKAMEYSGLRDEGSNIRPVFARGPFVDDKRFYDPVESGGFNGDATAASRAGFRGVQDQVAPGLGRTISVFDPHDIAPQHGMAPSAHAPSHSPPPRLPTRASDGTILPAAVPQPIRQSLVGGSADLADAARMGASDPLDQSGEQYFEHGPATIIHETQPDGGVYIHQVHVDPQSRRTGAARSAMSAFLSDPEIAGRNVGLIAQPERGTIPQSDLARFYESLGFRRTGNRSEMIRPASPRRANMPTPAADSTIMVAPLIASGLGASLALREALRRRMADG